VSESVSIDHESFSVDANDTSVILVAEGATFDGSYLDILKFGYSSNLLYASFWGFNAAINVVSRKYRLQGSHVCLFHVVIR
jgi:hypothetical protein